MTKSNLEPFEPQSAERDRRKQLPRSYNAAVERAKYWAHKIARELEDDEAARNAAKVTPDQRGTRLAPDIS